MENCITITCAHTDRNTARLTEEVLQCLSDDFCCRTQQDTELHEQHAISMVMTPDHGKMTTLKHVSAYDHG